MAKQQKKSQARRVPRATEPRMYGDGKPSGDANTTHMAGEPQAVEAPKTAVRTATRLTPTATSTPVAGVRTAGIRTSGATPRGSGSSGSFARHSVDRITDYSYVTKDLRRLGIVAASILATLVVLGIIVR